MALYHVCSCTLALGVVCAGVYVANHKASIRGLKIPQKADTITMNESDCNFPPLLELYLQLYTHTHMYTVFSAIIIIRAKDTCGHWPFSVHFSKMADQNIKQDTFKYNK